MGHKHSIPITGDHYNLKGSWLKAGESPWVLKIQKKWPASAEVFGGRGRASSSSKRRVEPRPHRLIGRSFIFHGPLIHPQEMPMVL